MSLRRYVSVLGAAGVAASAWAQCEQGWDDRFTLADLDGDVRSVAWHDDGSGARVYIAGGFTRIGGAAFPGVARWDGERWEADPGGLSGRVRFVEPASTGAPLLALGTMTINGGEPFEGIAAWDGRDWARVGAHSEVSGLAPSASGEIAYWAGDNDVVEIVVWDGHSSRVVATEPYGFPLTDLIWFGSGSGARLHAIGEFEAIGGVEARYAAAWDGESWHALGGGPPSRISGPVVFDDGAGPALYCMGDWAHRIVRWDGASWETVVGDGTPGNLVRLIVADVGGAPSLLTQVRGADDWAHLWQVRDGELSHLAGPIVGRVWDVASVPGTGELFVAGDILGASGVRACNLVAWDGLRWEAPGNPRLGKGVHGVNAVLATPDDGGPFAGRLFVGGHLLAGGELVGGVASWNGTAWESLGLPLEGFSGESSLDGVHALCVGDLGEGPRLFAGGRSVWDEAPYDSLAQWDGRSWSRPGDPDYFAGSIYNMAVHDDGSGPALYASGFAMVIDEGVEVNEIARLRNGTWEPVGGAGLPGDEIMVFEVCEFDDGSGPALYAAGRFAAIGGAEAASVARWNGSAWEQVGDGLTDRNGDPGMVWRLLATHVGGEPRLYAEGQFERSGDNQIGSREWAVWDGSAWRDARADFPLSPSAWATARLDGAEVMLAAGEVERGGPERIAVRGADGWSVLPGGIDGDVQALAASGVGGAESVYAFGYHRSFAHVDELPSDNVARFGCSPCGADFDRDGDVDGGDVAAFVNTWMLGDGAADFNDDGAVDTRDLVGFLNLWNAGC